MPHTEIPNHVRTHRHELPHSAELARLRAFDATLLADLLDKQPRSLPYSEAADVHCQNEAFAEIIQDNYSAEELKALEQQLHDQGTTKVSTVEGYGVEIDGETMPVSFVGATEISEDTPNHGEMASMLYLRDHIQTASMLMELHLSDPDTYKKEAEEGKRLLMSALHLMSTPAQLARFKGVIENGEASQEDWPHISLLFNDLDGREKNGWRNKQDTFQMLAYLACDALERGFIDTESLSDSHKTFLGSVAPLLKAVGFPKYENSGSWEEIAARRTSVMAVETALLSKVSSLTEANGNLAFLRGTLTGEEITGMRSEGLREIGRRLPFESPDHPKDSVKYRKADAALTYVLMYDIPKLLSDEHVPTGPNLEAMSGQAIEDLVLEELSTLIDPETGAMRRYDGDSYQRVNFHTNVIQRVIANIKKIVKNEANGGEIDLDKKQALRGDLTPKGREAAWTHPLGQLASWAAKRSITEQKAGNREAAENYRSLGTNFMNRTLATITGKDQWHAVLDDNKRYVVQKVPANRLPECYVTYETPDGTQFIVPSPHTPLNWSSAMLRQAVGLLRVSTVLQ
jgi:hypothetical protein